MTNKQRVQKLYENNGKVIITIVPMPMIRVFESIRLRFVVKLMTELIAILNLTSLTRKPEFVKKF